MNFFDSNCQMNLTIECIWYIEMNLTVECVFYTWSCIQVLMICISLWWYITTNLGTHRRWRTKTQQFDLWFMSQRLNFQNVFWLMQLVWFSLIVHWFLIYEYVNFVLNQYYLSVWLYLQNNCFIMMFTNQLYFS